MQHVPYDSDSANFPRRPLSRPASPALILPRLAGLILLALPLTIALPASAADGVKIVHLRIAGKEVKSKAAPVDTGAEIYIPLEALNAVGASGKINSRGDAATVTLPLTRKQDEFALARFSGVPMIALSDLARSLNAEIAQPDVVGIDGKTIEGKKGNMVYLLARVIDVHYAADTLRVTTSFPVPYHVRTLQDGAFNRSYLDCIGAFVADDFRPTPLAATEKQALRLRAGQFDVAVARVVVEMADGAALKASDSLANTDPEVVAGLVKVPMRLAHNTSPTRIADNRLQPPHSTDGTTPPKNQSSTGTGAGNPTPGAQSGTQTPGNLDTSTNVPADKGNTGDTGNPTPSATITSVDPDRSTMPSRGGKVVRTARPLEVRGLTYTTDDDKRFVLKIATSGKVNPAVHFVAGATQMQLDLPNSVLSLPETQTGDQACSHPLVSGLHVAQVQQNPPLTRVTVDLQRVPGFSVNTQGDGVSLELRLPRNATGALADKLIVIDAGHGGSSTGATGGHAPYVIYEKNVTLGISLKLRSILEACGARVVMTRDRDVDVPLYNRPRLANEINADFFISIHNDSNGVPNSASGTSTYYHANDASCRALATCIQHAVLAVTGLPSRGVLSDHVMYASGFAVLRDSTMPAILCEVAYINNARDRHKLVDSDFQQRVAQAICDGLRHYIEGNPRAAHYPPSPMQATSQSDGDNKPDDAMPPGDTGN